MNDHKKESSAKGLFASYKNTLEKAVEHFSFAEKGLFYVLGIIMIVSASVVVLRLNDFLLVEVPTKGGSITEGIIGSPRFINPLLAISDADRDLTSIVYSGLLKTAPDGTLELDLAKSYSVSPDGLTYSFILKDNLTFQDGAPLTAEDVEFTVLKAQDPGLKSPKRANWDSVQVVRVSETEIHFILKQPYAPFLENTTLGILPKHLWKNVSDDEFPLSFLNIEPIGSGPFMVNRITRNSSGIPEKYTLTPFARYALGEPYLSTLAIAFFPNEDSLISAFKQGTVDSINSITPEKVRALPLSTHTLLATPLSRVFGVFFNQNQATLFTDKYVRQALDESLDKEKIVNDVLFGFGVPANSPVPQTFLEISDAIDTATTTTDRIAEARRILEADGWQLNANGIYEKVIDKKKKTSQILSFSISTSNTPELKNAATLIKSTWEKVGAQVDLKIFEPGDLSQNVIRPRKYDALLFGEIVGRDLDLFAFWHSSQRNDPGLNIALYTNSKTDKLLSDARTISNRSDRLEKYRQFETELKKDTPAVFLYSPSFVYVVPKNLHGIVIGHVTVPNERFSTVENWYTETEKVWKFFMSKRITQ